MRRCPDQITRGAGRANARPSDRRQIAVMAIMSSISRHVPLSLINNRKGHAFVKSDLCGEAD